MFTTATKGVRFDFWTLMPEILKDRVGDEAHGELRFNDGKPSKARSVAERSYQAVFHWPPNMHEAATCILTFVYDIPRVILLIGSPDGTGSYKWRAACPHTRNLHQILQYDPSTKLFVSPEAIGRPAIFGPQHEDEYRIFLEKAYDAYGKFDITNPKEFPNLNGNSDFAPLRSFADILVIDLVFAKSGYPFAIRDAKNRIDVNATLLTPKGRTRLPRTLLSKNKNPRPARKFKNAEEVRAYFRERNIPLPTHLVRVPDRGEGTEKVH